MKEVTKDHHLSSALENIKSLMQKSKALVDMRSNILDLTRVVNYNTPEVTTGKNRNNEVTNGKIEQSYIHPSTIESKLRSDLETLKYTFTSLKKKVNNLLMQDNIVLEHEQIMSLTKEILHAELKTWLNDNLPGIVREVVAQQVQSLILNSNKDNHED